MKLFGTISKGKKSQSFEVPLVFNDILFHDLTTVDFTATGSQLEKGVFFKGDTAGYYTCVTFAQYLDNGGDVAESAAQKAAAIAAAISAGDTVKIYLQAYEWSGTTVVFIDATGAASDNVNLGIF